MPHPPPRPKIPTTRHKATIMTCEGWWWRYVVHRTAGIGIVENGVSCHRTLKGARRAAERWCRKDRDSGVLIEEITA
ncbi:MAG TPA: hypothetical protein VGF95_14560 [Solirubrobacteraceae bacterium]|jgi:hypothetical protein